MKHVKLFENFILEHNNRKEYYFLRWTSDPDQDIRRNFSGNMQAWFDTEEEALTDYKERIDNDVYIPYPPRKDITTNMWNSEPEWGLSGYGFYDEKTFIKAMDNIQDIAWHHKDNNGQDLILFKSDEYKLGDGFDGEDVFINPSKFWYIDDNINYDEILKLIQE